MGRPAGWMQELTERKGMQSSGAPSLGSVGDAYDNALAQSVIGLFKTEVIHRRGPWRGFDDVEYATLEWVAWFNRQRLLAPLGNVPPTEYEEQYYRQQQDEHVAQTTLTMAGALN